MKRLLPIRRSIRQAPDVGGFVQFDAKVRRFLIACENDSAWRGLAGPVYMDGDLRAEFQRCGGSDECPMQVHHRCFSGVGKALAFQFHDHVVADSRAAPASSKFACLRLVHLLSTTTAL